MALTPSKLSESAYTCGSESHQTEADEVKNYQVDYDVRVCANLGNLVEIGQGCNNRVDTECVQQFRLFNIPDECSYFECIPLGMSE